jgi:orotidine-5'-phosphate decarboxylase
MPSTSQQYEISTRDRIIVALDVDSESKARSLIYDLGDLVGAFKIGLQLFTAAGPNFVRWATESGHKIFLDLKFHDIPQTVAMAGVEAARLGVWMFNVHAIGGREMMKRTVLEVAETCDREKIPCPKIIAVTILTSSNAEDLIEVGIEKGVDKAVDDLARLSAESGLDGVVASAHEATAIKQSSQRPGFFVVTPGIRPLSGTNDDQKRVMTPADAIKSGSDYLVIGRPITGASDTKVTAEAIISEINASFPKV